MSTFLLSTMDAMGHVTPARAVAASLVSAGHTVLWHCWEPFRPMIEATGARFVPARCAPGFADLGPEPEPGTHAAAEAVSALRRLMVDRMAGQLADYETILATESIDAIMVDLCCLGGRALHERTAIPWATLGISPLSVPAPEIPPFGSGRQPARHLIGRLGNAAYWRIGSRFLRGLTVAYQQERDALGLAPLPHGTTTFDHMISDQLHLQASTPSIEFPRRHWPPSVRLVGPLLPPVPAGRTDATVAPKWWSELLEAQTVVHVTQGSVATDPDLLTRPAVQGLADLDALVVVTTSRPDLLGPVPANTRVAAFVPHAQLLPHVDVMVTNAGYNGVKAALGHAVPLVMAPWGNDQPDVAARVTRVGAGIDLRRRTPAPDQIRAAVEKVRHEPSYLQAAHRVRAEFGRYPGGDLAARELSDLIAGTSRTSRHAAGYRDGSVGS